MPDKGKNDNHSDTMVFYPPAAVIGLGSKARNWCLSHKKEACHCEPVCALARNDEEFFGAHFFKFQFYLRPTKADNLRSVLCPPASYSGSISIWTGGGNAA